MQSFNTNFSSEAEFDDAFDQNFTDEDKAYVTAVTSRLYRILNWTPEAGEKFMCDRKRGPQLIREILTRFLRWKEFVNQSDSRDSHRLQHLVIFSLAKLCLYYWITDSRLVAEILREVYECDGHFSSMFAHVVNRLDARSLLRNSSDYSRQREDFATVFFLHHAHKERIMFNGLRFLDLRLRFPLNIPPVFLAAIYNKPHLFLHLLRFGAKVDPYPDSHPDDWSVPMLLRHLIRILWNALGEDLEYFDRFTSDQSMVMSNPPIFQVVECLRILLRVIPQIRKRDLNFLLMKFQHGVLTGSVTSHDFVRKLSERNIVPKFVDRFLKPSELRHLCRCVIRNRLNTTWNLPYGVALLPLPKRMHDYLSLLHD